MPMATRGAAIALVASSLLLATGPLEARKGLGGLIDLMSEYKGRPVNELLDLIGYPNKQEQVLDLLVLEGGYDSEEGMSCQWWVTIDSNRIIQEVRIFGNDWGCGDLRKRAEEAKRAKSTTSDGASGGEN